MWNNKKASPDLNSQLLSLGTKIEADIFNYSAKGIHANKITKEVPAADLQTAVEELKKIRVAINDTIHIHGANKKNSEAVKSQIITLQERHKEISQFVGKKMENPEDQSIKLQTAKNLSLDTQQKQNPKRLDERKSQADFYKNADKAQEIPVSDAARRRAEGVKKEIENFYSNDRFKKVSDPGSTPRLKR